MRPVTAVTVLYRSPHLIPELSDTLRGLRPLCETILVDSRSEDGTADAAAAAMPWARHMQADENRGFGAANNIALSTVDTPFVLLMNPDASVGLEAVSAMVAFLRESPRYAACQPLLRLWDWPLAVAGAGTSMTAYGEGYDLRYMQLLPAAPQVESLRVPGVTAAVSLWRTEVLAECGGFDPAFFMYFEDVDLSLRAAARGWRFALLPGIEGRHSSGATSTRVSAKQWELTSSVILARRYLGAGRLPGSWLRREVRIVAAGLLRGRPAGWRIPALRAGLAAEVETVELGPEQRSLLRSRPMDKPLPRGSLTGPLCGGEHPQAGPGWGGATRAPRLAGQWGGIILPDGELSAVRLVLSSTCAYLSGVYACGGRILGRFSLPRGETRLEIPLIHGCRRVQLGLDGNFEGGKIVLEQAEVS